MGNYNTSKWQQALHLLAVITSCVALFLLFIVIIILVISQRHLGRFPFSQNFRNFRFGIDVSCSLYQFQVHGRAPGHVPGFTTKWNNFLPIGNSTFATTEISGFFS